MTGATEFATNSATAAEIRDHLSRCGESFLPPLHDRVDVAAYASKLWANAERFEAWVDGALVGLVAAYCNDAQRRRAFISSVSVESAYRGAGIASDLLDRCVRHAARLGFERIELEVDQRNAAAINLYVGRGFSVSEARGQILVLSSTIASG